ncbi:MAG: ribonuclease [Patescibacteria group bacterium]|jgi:ribonuclease HII|nr:ribonuclease [Patescibacteria group bacterium]
MKYIIGIDEVGRGPIAGPVAVCAFLSARQDLAGIIDGIDLPMRDSKKLTKIQREKWFEYLKHEKVKGNCDFAVSYVSAEMIDKFGIVKAIQKALNTSLEKLDFQNSDVSIYLDGGLKAPAEYTNQQTIIKGDELHPVISCASIVAKVSRDKVMANHAKEYPEYGFEKHSGYGTKAHYEAIKKYGATTLHRKTFLKGIL